MLLPTGVQVDVSEAHYPWKSYHTFTIICLRICNDVLMMAPLAFDETLSAAVLVSLRTFSYVNISRFVGVILAIFWSPLNMKWLSNDNKSVTVLYAVLSSVLTICFGLSFLVKVPTIARLPLQCALWLAYGTTASICNAGTMAVATQYSDPAKHGTILSSISLSWSLSSLFYLACAYLIELHPGLPFITFGTLLLFFAVLVQVTYNFPQAVQVPQTVLETAAADANPGSVAQLIRLQRQIIDIIRDEYYRLLLLISFAVGVASGANVTVLASPFLHDLYGLDVTLIGWALMAVFLGELSSNLFLIAFIGKQGYFTTAAFGLLLKTCAGACIIAIAFSRNSAFGTSLAFALGVVYAVNFAWELVFVSQLTAVNHAVHSKEQNMSVNTANSQKRLVFVIHNAAVSLSKLIGIWFAAHFWNDGGGLFDVGVLLICSSVVASICYCVYYQKRGRDRLATFGAGEKPPLLQHIEE